MSLTPYLQYSEYIYSKPQNVHHPYVPFPAAPATFSL